LTVPSESSSTSYTGNAATTDFSTSWRARLAAEVRVTLTLSGGSPVVQTLDTDYTIDNAPEDGSSAAMTVSFLAAPAQDAEVLLERDVSFTQDTSFRTQGSFAPKVHEDAFDESVYRDQELDRRISALESAGAVGSVVAGNGLAFAGDVLNVGAGAGIVATADAVAAAFSDGAPTAVDAAAADDGSADYVARSDHKHSATTASSTGAQTVGGAASAGTGTPLALATHVHAFATQAPSDIAKQAAAAGSSGKFADAAHLHQVSTAAAVELTDSANAEGAATSLARSNHTHSHGARGGGTLHADATITVAGFLCAADKVKLDALVAEVVAAYEIQTTDATPTKIHGFIPTNLTCETVEVTVAGKVLGGNGGVGIRRSFTVQRNDGTTTQVGATSEVWTHRTTGTEDVTISLSSPDVNIHVTGLAGTTIDWRAVVRRVVNT